MTLMYEFNWEGNTVDEKEAEELVKDFYLDPTNFIHPLEDDEVMYVHIEEVNDCAG